MDDTTDELFCDLMELPPGKRAGALDAMVDVPAGRRLAVLRMLGEAEAADEYFTGSSAAVKMLPVSSRAEGVEDMCGPYRLVRKLGEGGFGVVWLAAQEKPLRRTVAVKVIKAGMDTEEVLARFEAEKEAIARMEHPNIAKVLDAGMTENGRSFFVMELVEGESITKHCQSKKLGIQERLRLFSEVCGAINHAHQKGVIHRDIKPSNVIVTMIGSKPVAKVIDFGIAKAIEGELTDFTLRTRAEQWIGTPAYMSPEQAGLGSSDVDTRSDIYALGVLLYELITDEAPFHSKTLLKAGYEEVRRMIREVEPPRPSVRIITASSARNATKPITKHTQIRGIASELDWIVMKAMEKARERRYESADALADDVGRYLADEPVIAKPPSSAYLLSKFARRHRRAMLLLAAFSSILVSAVIFSSWQAFRARQAEMLAEERLDEVVRQQREKDIALQDAEAVTRLFSEVLKRPDPQMDGRQVTVVKALESATAKLDKQLKDQPLRQAVLLEVVANTYDGLALYAESLALRERVLELRRAQDEPAPYPGLLAAIRALVVNAEKAGNYGMVVTMAAEEVESLRKTAGTAYEAALRSLARGHYYQGDVKKAVETQNVLLTQVTQRLGSLSHEVSKTKWELNQYLSEFPGGTATEEEAVRNETDIIREARETWESHTRDHGAADERSIAAQRDYAGALWSANHMERAVGQMTRACDAAIKNHGSASRLTMDIQKSLARMLHHSGKEKDAVRVQQQFVESLRGTEGETATITLNEEELLKRYFFYSGMRDEYRQFLNKTLERRKLTLGEDNVYTAHIHDALSLSELFDSRLVEALEHAEIAAPIMLKTYGPEDRSTANAMGNLARALSSLGRTKEAIDALTRCGLHMRDDTYVNLMLANLQIWTGDLNGYHATRRWMIDYQVKRRDTWDARSYILERAVRLCCMAPLENEEQGDELLKTWEIADKVRESATEEPRRHAEDELAWFRGLLSYRRGEFDKALEEFDEVEALRRKHIQFQDTKNAYRPDPSLLFLKAMTLHGLGRRDEAASSFHVGVRLLPDQPPGPEPLKGINSADGIILQPWIFHKEAGELLGLE